MPYKHSPVAFNITIIILDPQKATQNLNPISLVMVYLDHPIQNIMILKRTVF